jgi:hypothetical protein
MDQVSSSEQYAAQFGMRLWKPADRLGPYPGPFQRSIEDDRGRSFTVSVGGNN